MDNDKANEQVAISQLYNVNLFTVDGNSITVKCNLTNTGTVVVQLIRLWVEDLTTNQSQNGGISVVLQQGQIYNYSSSLIFSTPIHSTDQFRFWFVSARGNDISISQTAISYTQITNMINRGISNVIGEFLPNYLSVQWAPVNQNSGAITGSWADGWIIPSNLNIDHMAWRVNMTYYGTTPITLDRNSMLLYFPFSGQNPGGKAPPMCYIVAYNAGTNSISSYVGNEFQITPGTNLTIYFGGDGSPNLHSGIPQSYIDQYGDMLTLVIYGAAPSHYAQSYPLFAIFTRNSPIVNSNPTTGRIGSSVTETGSNFAASSLITIYFDQQQISTVTSDATGSFTKAFTVPTSTSGSHTIMAVDANANSASNQFTVSAPTINLNINNGRIGTSVTVSSGSNFFPSSTVTITWDGVTVATAQATSTGTLPSGIQFNVPPSTAGVHNIVANDGVNSASSQFTVSAPTITLNPTHGVVGTMVTVSGSNFVPSSTVTITYDGVAVVTTTATSSGSLPIGGSAPQFNIPASTNGLHTVISNDGVNSASKTFNVP